MVDLIGLVGLVIAGVAACAINSVAGGGTLISFPALVAYGEPTLFSNATSMGATGVGSLSSALGYRRGTRVHRGLFLTLAVPNSAGVLTKITAPNRAPIRWCNQLLSAQYVISLHQVNGV